MIVKFNVSKTKGEIKITHDANIDDAVEAITGVLIAEGYMPGSIIDGYARMIKRLREAE